MNHYDDEDEDFITISAIQHFIFCRRRWALMFIECVWDDNELTASGTLMHERVHDPSISDKRGDLLTVRDMPVLSRRLAITGKCDVVEFRKDDAGVNISRREGKWLPCPVEYKHGRAQKNDSDRLQLCAQAICLEEMLNCPPIDTAYIYYGETKRREAVHLDAALRQQIVGAAAEIREYSKRGHTPRTKPQKACVSCSLKDACMPKLPSSSVQSYIDKKFKDEGQE